MNEKPEIFITDLEAKLRELKKRKEATKKPYGTSDSDENRCRERARRDDLKR